jgi:tetratricopeptide (TPR) repeat protein
MRQARRLYHAVSTILMLTLAVGCAGIPLPKTITEGDVTPQLKKRNEKFTKQFDEQREFAEYEAAKTRWVQQRDPKGCREALEKLLARKPQHREARLLIAELLLSENDLQAAYQHAKAALDAYPNDAQVQYTVALVLDVQGKTSDALGYYERATKMDPRSESFAAAYQTAREAARADSTGRGNSADSAGAAESGPAAELLGKAEAALAEGAPRVALEHFRQAAAIKPDNPQIPLSAAAAALRANRPDLAVELLVPAAKQFPKSAAVHRMLGAAYYRTGDFQSSQVALQQALSLDKSSALSYLLMGCALAKLGQQQAAEAHFRQARTLDPRYTIVR